ncbi:MAG: PD-(D/E)XK nuclease-like domain-containing protein, partial [Janthinobacterium lividum]
MSEVHLPTTTAPALRITELGLYDMPADVYHADACPEPSLSAGMIGDLLTAPAKCWDASPRLNPAWEPPEGQEKFTIGTVSHLVHLEPEKLADAVVVVEARDWKGKAAQAARTEAADAGKIAILAKHMRDVLAARRAFLASPLTRGAFTGGKAEQSLFWRHPRYGFWCRCRPDYLADSRAYMADYKATANADPRQFGKHAYQMGYHRRAAWYAEGARAVLGVRSIRYLFCNQETKRPFLTSVVELDLNALEAGQAENDAAAAIFDRCLRTGEWPGYRSPATPDRDTSFVEALPTWALMQSDNRLNHTFG